MSACSALSYTGVDADAWARVKALAAQQYAIAVDSDVGSASSAGFTIGWDYDAGAQALEIQCTDSPWAVPCEAINAHLDAAIKGAIAP